MLIGTERLAKVKGIGDVSKSGLVRSAGYVCTKKDGTDLSHSQCISGLTRDLTS
jgi:hypothetical protein